MIDVSVIVVTYNSSRYVCACLEAVSAAVGRLSHEIVVVDNDSRDDTLLLVAEIDPYATVIRNNANTGFAVASNQGIRAARGRYALMLNPDTVASPMSIERLVAHMDAHPRAGIAGPRLHDQDAALQYSVRNFPSPCNQFFESLFLHRVMPRMSGRFGEVVYDVRSYEASHSVDWLSGATLLVRPEALEEVGLLDERFFMYSEEKDLCYRMFQAGWTVDYVADACVAHGHDGHESAEAFARRLRSRMLYFDKHYRGWRKLGSKAGLYFGLLTRVFAGICAATLRSDRRHHLLVPLRGVSLYLRSSRRDSQSREVAVG